MLRRRDVLASGVIVPQGATFGVAGSRHSSARAIPRLAPFLGSRHSNEEPK